MLAGFSVMFNACHSPSIERRAQPTTGKQGHPWSGLVNGRRGVWEGKYTAQFKGSQAERKTPAAHFMPKDPFTGTEEPAAAQNQRG